MIKASKPKLSEVLEELKNDYLITLPKKISALKTLTEQENWVELKEEYHKLKGSGKTYGFPEISKVSEKLESMAEQKKFRDPKLFREAVSLFERLHQSYLENKSYDLEQDSFARTLLALIVN